MSVTLELRPTSTDDTWAIGSPRLLAGLDRRDRLDLPLHLAAHGPLPGTDLDRLLLLLDSAGLTGRGGACFPLGDKIRSLRGGRPTVIVNGSESEPASRKDRVLLRRAPHLVLDGALALAGAVRADRVIVAVHDPVAAQSIRDAIRERGDAKQVRLRETSGRFVAGEARALLRGLAGGPALPPGRRELPTTQGRLVSNVETFAQTAILLRAGARGFAATGTRDEPGTTLLTVGGAVGRPGVVEIPIGAPLGIVLRAAHAHAPRYVVTGGYHGTWIAVAPDVPISRAGLAAVGGSLGAGVLLAVDDSTCALGELADVSSWLADQSAKQCGPCRSGLPALALDVAAALDGQPGAVATAQRHAGLVTGRGACAHPDGAARFVRSGLAVLREDVLTHQRGGCGRPVRGLLPRGGPR